MIGKDTTINIYNEYDGDIYGISSVNEYGYKFPRVNEYGEATPTIVVFSDVQMMNNKSALIREGVLTFDEDQEVEIYKLLNVFPSKNVNFFKKTDILKTLLNATDDNINKIIQITSKTTMERIKSILTKIINSNQYDVVNTMTDYINARDWELKQGTRNSELRIIKREIPTEFIEQVEEEEVEIEETPEVIVEIAEKKVTPTTKAPLKKVTTKKVNK